MIEHPKDLIGKTVRIRLPDYVAKNDFIAKDPVNFSGTKQITIEEISRHFAECYDYEKAAKVIMHDDLLFYGWKPPTKWQRFKNRLKDYHQRAKDIWTILKGDDVHKDCGY